MLRDFDKWLSTMRESINTYDYYVDFDKVYKNVDNIKLELNILNYLVGSKNIEDDFKRILTEYPKTLKAIPVLLAKRETEIFAMDDNGARTFTFNRIPDNLTIDDYCYFMRETGLFELLEKHIINNLVDYVLGIEVGLDTNARKNRGGDRAEDLVEEYIKALGVEYYKEMTTPEIRNKWKINLHRITNGSSVVKRFDFVIKTDNQIYCIETNFYTGQGSKLNETARSFKNIAEEALFINGLTFIWITDGIKGWKSARNNLKETFDVLEHLYNINDLENGILEKVIK